MATTLEQALRFQKDHSVLTPPTSPPDPASKHDPGAAATPTTVQFALRNNTSSANVFAYVTGLDVGRDSRVVMLRSDGQTTYYPTNPGADLQPLGDDCAIPLAGPGQTRTVTVPRMVGGRVWFVQDARLTFLLNRAAGDKAALVEPSVVNPSDPNRELRWSFCEFTLNETELFANISYVDFVSHPIALVLESGNGGSTQRVEGIEPDGLARVAAEMARQHERDGAGWDRLVVRAGGGSGSGELLRVVSPNTGIHMVDGLFSGYYAGYVDAVWKKYASADLVVNTQAQWGDKKGRVVDDKLVFSADVGAFPRPSARDIFSSDSGALAPPPGSDPPVARNVAARLAAAFNRATLLVNAAQPQGEVPATYYREAVCNHYSRVLHEVNTDGRGYAFPYDDVGPSGGSEQAGTVADSNPKLFTIILGGRRGAMAHKL
ncbi:hypothetical protein GGTG_12901 [Gaeumannomyces tritici R3-111a-1]|uniref:GH64 domain-containing protein n=1 Tax=Gaeumannomyces tritici (strain R3-111a-1) TaxID=644352 RepID=J3PHC2_GAET3|nr:hypothetical protein GGTG_12901 [Gaeumannomyces tritici R3-111a-1]EJT69282.1 hypothetical protein GGTG_12901 [Gaeumannomyces tritici R3-111a-1]